MSYRPTNIGALIQIDPKVAASRLLKQLKAHDANLMQASKTMGVSASTIHRWMVRLSERGHDIRPQLEKIRNAAA